MARIYAHSILESAVCEAKFLDALKVRYGKVGPTRQGQAGHALAASYMTHLFRTKRDSDMATAAEMWRAMRHQLTANDERAVEDSIVAFYEKNTYPWVAAATALEAEAVVFVTVPDRVVVPVDRVHLLDGPVFRVTVDLMWRGTDPFGFDCAENDLAILDWKFHRVIEHVENPDANRQLLRYAATVRAPGEDVRAYLGFPRKSYYENTFFDDDTLTRAWEELVVAPVMAAEKKRERAPEVPDKTVGGHCRRCDLLKGCDAAQRYPYEIVALENATATQKATSFMIARELTKILQGSTRIAINEGEAIDDDDIEAEIGYSEFLSFDRKDLDAILGEHVMPEVIEACMRANKTSVTKALTKARVPKAKREELLAELRAAKDTQQQLRSRLTVGAKKHARAAQDVADEADGEGSA